MLTEWVGVGNDPGFALQRDRCRVAGQAIEVGAVKARERFEPVECARAIERFGINLDCGMSRITAGATASAFLLATGMRRRVGAEKILGVAAGRRSQHGKPVRFAL